MTSFATFEHPWKRSCDHRRCPDPSWSYYAVDGRQHVGLFSVDTLKGDLQAQPFFGLAHFPSSDSATASWVSSKPGIRMESLGGHGSKRIEQPLANYRISIGLGAIGDACAGRDWNVNAVKCCIAFLGPA